MSGIIGDEVKKLGREPRRWRQMFHLRRWRQFASILLFRTRAGEHWAAVAGDGELKRREYVSYGQYVRHQGSKFQYLDLAEYDARFRQRLQERLRDLRFVKRGASALCLGARQGSEVRAFHDLGCFAVGVDLNPGKANPFVVQGDFHHLQFPAESADLVYTNSFDHAYDAEKLTAEITRVLKTDGVLIIEAMRGEAEQNPPDHYASFWWRRVDDLAAWVERHGYRLVNRAAFVEPWAGEQLCFQKVPGA